MWDGLKVRSEGGRPGRTWLPGWEGVAPGPGLHSEALKASLWPLSFVGTWGTLKRLPLQGQGTGLLLERRFTVQKL